MMPMESPSKSPIAWVCGAVAVLVWLIRFPLSQVRFFDPDEFQHMHHAWYVSMGKVPYRDFIDHHTPLYHAFLAPFFSMHDVAASASEGEAMLFLARRISWILSALIIVLAFELARRWRGRDVAFVSTALLSTTIMFVDKTLEIRPDLFTMVFWVGALILVLEGINSDGSKPRRDMLLFAGSGACMGLGLLSSQKLLFAGPGLAATMIWFLLDNRSPIPMSRRIALLVAQVVGLLAPIAIALGVFASMSAMSAFIHYNLSANVGLGDRFSPISRTRTLLRQNPFYIALGLTGLIPVALRLRQPESARRGDYLVVLNLIGLVIGLFLNPVPYDQSFLTLMPLVAMLAASYIVGAIRGLFEAEQDATTRERILVAGVGVLLVAFCIRYSVPIVTRYGLLFPAGAVLTAALSVYCYRTRAASALIATVTAFLVILPIAQLTTEFRATSKAQFAELESVYANSSPTDTFLDGFTGYGLFRPHASRFWFLHTEMQAMMTPDEKSEIVSGVITGRITPKMIGYDRSLKSLSPVMNQYIEANYRQLGTGPLYVRR